MNVFVGKCLKNLCEEGQNKVPCGVLTGVQEGEGASGVSAFVEAFGEKSWMAISPGLSVP